MTTSPPIDRKDQLPFIPSIFISPHPLRFPAFAELAQTPAAETETEAKLKAAVQGRIRRLACGRGRAPRSATRQESDGCGRNS